MKIAPSISTTSRNGSDADLKTNAMMKKMIRIDAQLTTLKSWFAMLTRSFVQGASPISSAFLSY